MLRLPLLGLALSAAACSFVDESEQKTTAELSRAAVEEDQAGAGAPSAETILFAGHRWRVKSGASIGPGPNRWDRKNVFVDGQGALHLRVTQRRGSWTCAEVESVERFGWGTYRFDVVGRVDRFAPTVVLGLFNYPTHDVGVDGTHEIDIEFSKWGDPAADVGNFGVYPTRVDEPRFGESFPLTLSGTHTTHTFDWQSDRVQFWSAHGHRTDGVNKIAKIDYQPSDKTLISQRPQPVHMNLWLFQGRPPADGVPVEVVISSFAHVPR